MECELCNQSRITGKMIKVKTDIIRYFCDWECLYLYCKKMLNISTPVEDDYEEQL